MELDLDHDYSGDVLPFRPVARLPTELYSLIASFVLSERPIAKIHTFRKSPWRIIAGATLASRAMRAAFMQAWFRVLRIRQVGDFNFIDQKMNWMFPWVRYVLPRHSSMSMFSFIFGFILHQRNSLALPIPYHMQRNSCPT
jgi:hypothetical protein